MRLLSAFERNERKTKEDEEAGKEAFVTPRSRFEARMRFEAMCELRARFAFFFPFVLFALRRPCPVRLGSPRRAGKFLLRRLKTASERPSRRSACIAPRFLSGWAPLRAARRRLSPSRRALVDALERVVEAFGRARLSEASRGVRAPRDVRCCAKARAVYANCCGRGPALPTDLRRGDRLAQAGPQFASVAGARGVPRGGTRDQSSAAGPIRHERRGFVLGGDRSSHRVSCDLPRRSRSQREGYFGGDLRTFAPRGHNRRKGAAETCILSSAVLSFLQRGARAASQLYGASRVRIRSTRCPLFRLQARLPALQTLRGEKTAHWCKKKKKSNNNEKWEGDAS